MSASGLSLCISVRLLGLEVRAGAEAPRGMGGKRRRLAREESVNPQAKTATAQSCRATLGSGNVRKHDKKSTSVITAKGWNSSLRCLVLYLTDDSCLKCFLTSNFFFSIYKCFRSNMQHQLTLRDIKVWYKTVFRWCKLLVIVKEKKEIGQTKKWVHRCTHLPK